MAPFTNGAFCMPGYPCGNANLLIGGVGVLICLAAAHDRERVRGRHLASRGYQSWGACGHRMCGKSRHPLPSGRGSGSRTLLRWI